MIDPFLSFSGTAPRGETPQEVPAELELFPSESPAEYAERMMQSVYASSQQQAAIEAYRYCLPIARVGLAHLHEAVMPSLGPADELFDAEVLGSGRRLIDQGIIKPPKTPLVYLQQDIVPGVIYSLNRLHAVLDRKRAEGREVGSLPGSKIGRGFRRLLDALGASHSDLTDLSPQEKLRAMSDYISSQLKATAESVDRNGAAELSDFEHLAVLIDAYLFPPFGIAYGFSQNMWRATEIHYGLRRNL